MWTEPVPCWRRIDLVEWAIKAFPDSPPSKFNKMKKDQLWAIWYNLRKRKGSKMITI